MKKAIRFYLIGLSLLCLGGQLLLGCNPWELPSRKTQRNCVKPAGTLEAQMQQRKVDFSISGSSGTIDKVTWDFGNGSTSVTTGMTVSYTYPTSSTYTAKATLTNTCGDETTLLRTIGVSDAVSPTVSLQPATDLSTASAILRMTITASGNSTITRYGVCYSTTNPVPEVGKDNVLDIMGTGAISTPFSFSLTTLQPNTTYYARSFAINQAGKTGYSDPVQTFRTGQSPSVTSNGTATPGIATATVNFVLTNPGSPAAVEYGICYSPSATTPDITNSSVTKVTSPATGASVAVNLSDLTPNKMYYYRAYAKSASGEVVYGPIMSFTTLVDTVAQDLIAAVSFTNGSLEDASGNNNRAILVNSPAFTADRKGNANSAILLNGSGNYFYMADNNTLRPDALSVSIWIKPVTVKNIDRSQNDRVQIYNKSKWEDSSGEMYSSLIKLNENGPGLTFMTNLKQNSDCLPAKGWQNFEFSSNPQLSTWHHLVFTYSGRSIRMYFDGALQDQNDNLPASMMDKCPGGELKFGAQLKAYPNYFNGAMDDIKIYKRALVASEVQTLFNQ